MSTQVVTLLMTGYSQLLISLIQLRGAGHSTSSEEYDHVLRALKVSHMDGKEECSLLV